jgi:hypothetical protein
MLYRRGEEVATGCFRASIVWTGGRWVPHKAGRKLKKMLSTVVEVGRVRTLEQHSVSWHQIEPGRPLRQRLGMLQRSLGWNSQTIEEMQIEGSIGREPSEEN